VNKISPKDIFDGQKFSGAEIIKDLIYRSEGFKIMRISLKKGLKIEPHTGTHIVFFLVLKGRGIFTTESGDVELGENEYISLKESEPRGIRSLEDLVVLAIRD